MGFGTYIHSNEFQSESQLCMKKYKKIESHQLGKKIQLLMHDSPVADNGGGEAENGPAGELVVGEGVME